MSRKVVKEFAMLFPISTETRRCTSLDGIWDFSLLEIADSYDPSLPLKNGLPMPVPSAYNDIYEGREFRDHVGSVVYERTIDLPAPEPGHCLILHFGSVAHSASVWWNGKLLGSHKGGFLPFEWDVTELIMPGTNRITVIVDNIVDHTTLPCGTVQNHSYPGLAPKRVNLPNFDFFNYSGILRPVKLLDLPKTRIKTISVSGTQDGSFRYEIGFTGEGECEVEIKEKDTVLWKGTGAAGNGRIDGILPWSPEHPALYDFRVTLSGADGSRDLYTEPFGFRSIEIRDGSLCLNGEKLYLKGFGKHEDTPVLGRALSEAYNVKDLALMKWMGANSFRTSHYPYSEEMLRLCDRMGILVIDEAPAVGMHTTFTATGMRIDVKDATWDTLKTQEHHKDVLKNMITRDQNHPCVIMWSVANEPASEEKGAYEYFEPLFRLVRETDPQHRPVTFVTHGEATVETCEVAPLCDVLVLNRYYGWYSEEGDLTAAKALLSDELDRYHQRYPDKPIMLGEFGADAVAGLHDSTPQMFSEEYQRDLIEAYCSVLDQKMYICGEHVWNFADFATAESVKRVQGNKKGVFTRERKPKLAVWFLRSRWKQND